MPFPKPVDLPGPGTELSSLATAGRFFMTSTTWGAHILYAKRLLFTYSCNPVCLTEGYYKHYREKDIVLILGLMKLNTSFGVLFILISLWTETCLSQKVL